MSSKHFPATLPCDWGYAFDYLSIFEVKKNKFPNSINEQNFNETLSFLSSQFVSLKDFFKIYDSKYYTDLVNVNSELFDLVDAAKTDKVKASEVDAGVWKRYLAKKSLQEKFFPNTVTNEQKIGYKT